MHLPEPALTLTLPSIHDGTTLDCRIYHPLNLSASTSQPRHAAVIAHPYAPLGGSYDDPVVEEVSAQLLRQGFLVSTFNFRGAGHSQGRTSWSAKPERDDYASIVGFLVYYVHHLDHARHPEAPPPILLLGGYSYGAMVTAQLPPLPAMLAPFAAPTISSHAAQIRNRAESLADQQRELMPLSPGSHALRVGDGGNSPRKSHEGGRRSFSLDDAEDMLRKGAHDLFSKRHRHPSLHHHRTRSTSPSSGADARAAPTSANPALSPPAGLVHPRPAYLLISPLQGMITHLATMSRSPADPAAEAKMRQHPTLAVYGDRDVFVGYSKLRAWTKSMEDPQESQFQGRLVDGAGHFWIEEGTLKQMKDWVVAFAKDLRDM